MQRYDKTTDLESRVRETDAVVGVTMKDGMARIVVEGNEDKAFVEGTQAIVGLALGASGEIPAYKSETLEAKGTTAYTVTMIAMLLMSLFIGGATVGMSIVDERECGVIRAVAVSPMRLGGYAATKLFPALVLGGFGISAAALIIGKAAILPQYLLLAFASIFVSGMMTFAVGGFANNQVAAVGRAQGVDTGWHDSTDFGDVCAAAVAVCLLCFADVLAISRAACNPVRRACAVLYRPNVPGQHSLVSGCGLDVFEKSNLSESEVSGMA